jgi:hypothetical protein
MVASDLGATGVVAVESHPSGFRKSQLFAREDSPLTDGFAKELG